MADRNKTELTQNITRLMALWLDGKGFKPVETEIAVADHWVADVAGVCCPTMTELINLKLIGHRPRSPRNWPEPASEEDLEQYRRKSEAWDAKKGTLPSLLTATVEVKVSVGDFRGDSKWTRPWPTNLCYVAMPEGLIPPERWPKGWGVILFNRSGTTVRRSFPSECRIVTADEQLDVVLALAISRDHKTRYRRMREFEKTVRIKDAERKTVARVQQAIRFVRSVIDGKPISEAARYHGIRAALPSNTVADLEGLRPRVATASSLPAIPYPADRDTAELLSPNQR